MITINIVDKQGFIHNPKEVPFTVRSLHSVEPNTPPTTTMTIGVGDGFFGEEGTEADSEPRGPWGPDGDWQPPQVLGAPASVNKIIYGPIIGGSLSAVSSAIIIFIILRSQTRLGSIYHRIMMGMSLADIIGSLSMALTTLPMPSTMEGFRDKPIPIVDVLPRVGSKALALGNLSTCNAQGFFSTFGISVMFGYNVMLCLFYACALAIKMREKTIKRYVEPFLHFLPLVVGLGMAIPPLFHDMYNPSSAALFCTINAFPALCTNPDVRNSLCIRGTKELNDNYSLIMKWMILGAWVIITASLLLILIRTIMEDRSIKLMLRMYRSPLLAGVFARHQNSKVIVVQALAYILGFILTLVFPFMRRTGRQFRYLDILRAIFLPIQGFLNMLIFIGHKIYNYRRAHPHVQPMTILKRLFQRQEFDDPVLISRIFIVKQDQDDEYEISYEDEKGELKSFKSFSIHSKDVSGSGDNQEEQEDINVASSATPQVTFDLKLTPGEEHRSIGNNVFIGDVDLEALSLGDFDESSSKAPSSSSQAKRQE